MKELSCEIYDTTKYFYVLLRSLGLSSYQFDKKSLTFKTSLWNYGELLAWIFFWFGLIWVSCNNFEENTQETGVDSVLLDMLWKYQFILQHVFAIITILFNFVKRKNIENCLKSLFNFDQMLQRFGFGHKVMHSRYLIVIFYMISLMAVLLHQFISVYIKDGYGAPGNFAVELIKVMRIVAYIAVVEFYLLISMQFILSTHYVDVRLKLMIKLVRLVSQELSRNYLESTIKIFQLFVVFFNPTMMRASRKCDWKR